MFNLQQKITPFLWFDKDAEAAAELYVNLLGNGRIQSVKRWGSGSPYPAGSVMAVTLELHGQSLIAFNGGPHFKLNEAASLFVTCDTPAEVDKLWEGLTANGGQPSQCGWLKDPFGLSWQIVPRAFMQMMSDSDGARVSRVMRAMMELGKLDMVPLQRAYDGA